MQNDMNGGLQRFFLVLFGGLFVVGGSLAIAWAAGFAWRFVRSALDPYGGGGAASAAAIAALERPSDGTTVSGMTRYIRYTAAQEEDLISETAKALPSGADSRVSAAAYIVKDLDTGSVAAEYNQDKLLPMASLTKLVTAVIARRLIPSDKEVEITPEIISTYGNTAGLKAGESISASDLLYPLLMVSSNDAAEAYARSYGRPAFVKAMNDFVQSIGAYRTYFADPSGLSPENESSATDMSIILDWIRKNDPTILAVTLTKSKSIRGHSWLNPTHFLSWSYYLGGKNGYTDEADQTGSSLFSAGPNKDAYAVVVLGSSDRDADVLKLLEKIK